MLIGITGQIGAGKSTAAKILESMGIVVIDADRIGKKVVDECVRLRQDLVREFGTEILSASGKLRRKKLAESAFASETNKAKLDRLVHPYLLRELRKQVRSALHRSDLVVIDAALLLDWNMDREVDQVWVIHASQACRLKRLAERGVSRADALARQRAQPSLREFRRRAHRVISNETTRAALKKKISRLYDGIIDPTR
jgi:dephospho-CoA kinase